jgi:glycosyltransferase involved in cell wall biosynthesis
MKKKKLFIYIHQGILKGGVEKVFFNLLNNIPIEEYDITVLSVMGYLKNDFDSQLYPSQVKRYCLMWDELSTSNPIRRICQKIHNRIFPLFYKLMLRFKHYDIAIAAQEGMYADFIINYVKARKKFLWIHNDISQCHWSLNYFKTNQAEFDCYKQFNKIICVSESVKSSMIQVFGKMDNLCVCYNPIDTHEIDAKLQEQLPEKLPSPWFVCIGRLANQKGYDRLIEVCHRLNEEGYKYQISILGDGEDKNLLEGLLKEYDIRNIHLLGNKENPFVYVKQADWLLLPSRHEGFGMVLHESVYCCTPIITTQVAGAKELLGESEYGIIVENSKESIYNGMKKILDNPQIHEEYKEAVKRRVPFVNLNKRIDKILNVLNS